MSRSLLMMWLSLFMAAPVFVAAGCDGGSLNARNGDGGTGGGGTGGAGGTGAGAGCRASGCNHPPAQHRVQGATCSVDRTGAGGAGGAPELCGGSDGAGGRGSICTGGLNAACCHDPSAYWNSNCAYDQCATDSDCGPMAICVCVAGTGACDRNACQQGGCRIDADCGTGMYCSPSRNYPIQCQSAYMCHTPDDECIDDSDCNGGQGGLVPYCAFDGTVMHWKCTSRLVAGCPS